MFIWQKPTLKRLLERRDRLPHALLLAGSQGTGPAEFSLWLAQSLLCEQPDTGGEACRGCAACHWFSQGNHPDFRRIQPDSFAPETEEGAGASKDRKSEQIRIDQVRGLQEFLSVGTHRSGARVVLLHPADCMNGPTQNALLKNLEEPAAHTVFLLATSQPHRLLPTLRSRCQSVPLPRPTRAESIAWLRSQGIDEPDSLLALAGGAPLDAAAMAGERKFVDDFAERLSDRSMDPLALAQSVQAVPAAEVVTELYRWCYDLLSSRLCGKVRYHVTREPAIAAAAKRCDPVRLAAYVRTLCEARAIAEHPLNARLLVEDILLQYSRATATAAARP